LVDVAADVSVVWRARGGGEAVKKRRPVVRENHGPERKKKGGERGKRFINDVFRSCWLGAPTAAGIIAV
jgi:hypothetical protein